jgi:hypothetical protein
VNLIEHKKPESAVTEQCRVLREQKQVFQHGVVGNEDVRRLSQHFIAREQPVCWHGLPTQTMRRLVSEEWVGSQNLRLGVLPSSTSAS